MNYCIRFGVIITSIILFISCSEKKQKECVAYFDSVKEQIKSIQANMNKIADTLTDIPENISIQPAASILMQEEAAKKNDPYGFKSRRQKTFAYNEAFIISAEAVKKKKDLQWLVEDSAVLPCYRADIGPALIQYGEDIRSGKKDCFLGTQVNYLQRDADDFLKIKYLVITDCIASRMPQQTGTNTYSPGFLVKNIRVVEIASGKVVEQYYISATSSPSLTIANYDYSRIQGDLRTNAAKAMGTKVFGSSSMPQNLNKFRIN